MTADLLAIRATYMEAARSTIHGEQTQAQAWANFKTALSTSLKVLDARIANNYYGGSKKMLSEHTRESHQVIDAHAEFVTQREIQYYTVRGALLKNAKAVPESRMQFIWQTASLQVAADAEDRALESPALKDFFPFMVYLATQDARTRPTHKAMHGFACLRTWEGYWRVSPPCGWRCRCRRRFVSLPEATKNGWLTKDGTPKWQVWWPSSQAKVNYTNGIFPDPSFPKHF